MIWTQFTAAENATALQAKTTPTRPHGLIGVWHLCLPVEPALLRMRCRSYSAASLVLRRFGFLAFFSTGSRNLPV